VDQLKLYSNAFSLIADFHPEKPDLSFEEVDELASKLEKTGLNSKWQWELLRTRLQRGKNSYNSAELQKLKNKAILAAIEREGDCLVNGNRWKPVPFHEAGSTEQVEWVWDGFLAKSQISLLSGYPKAGKTTLMTHMIKLAAQGGTLGTSVRPGKILVVSEESGNLWRRRSARFGLVGDVLAQPFAGRPTKEQWKQFIGYLTKEIRNDTYDVVIFDTLASLAPIADENDSAHMLDAITPLNSLSGAGAAVLLIHHIRKSDATQGMAVRGSSALPGFVDIILELRAYDPSRRMDTRRRLTTFSRFEETPREVILEWTPTGYNTLGEAEDLSMAERWDTISDILSLQEDRTASYEEILEHWPGPSGCRPSLRTIRGDCTKGAEQDIFVRVGSGRRSSPFRVALPERETPPS